MVQLPDDIYLAIFAFLELGDIPRLRTVNKKLLQLTRAKSLWTELLHTHIVQKNVPIPGIRGILLDDLQSHELEAIARKALKHRLNWTSLTPVAKRGATVRSILQGRIIFLQFLEIPGRDWLLSLSVETSQGTPVRRFLLECWDLSSSSPVCIARQEFHQFSSIVVNQDSTDSDKGIVAVQAPFITIYSITPSHNDPESGFVPIGMFPEREDRINAFSGSKMLTTHQDGRIYLWDTRQLNTSWELTNPRCPRGEPGSVILAATFSGDCVTIVRPTVCESYAIPSLGDTPGPVRPVSEHVWPWKVDSVVMSQAAVVTPRSRASRRRHTSIIMLIRFGSIYPWPINLLHQFEISLNANFLEDQLIHAGNTPYRYPPDVRQTHASPLNLFSQTDMALGPYGTAIWIDTHTEHQFGPGQGQRLAARVTAPSEVYEDGGTVSLEPPDEIDTTAAASVLRWNEGASWIKVAMDEGEGNLALGDREGAITVLSYV